MEILSLCICSNVSTTFSNSFTALLIFMRVSMVMAYENEVFHLEVYTNNKVDIQLLMH